jgi:cytochrome c5
MKSASVLFLGLVVSLSFSGTSFAAGHEGHEKGAELLESRCSVCHPAARPMAAKKTQEEWDVTVTRMIGKGAKLTVDEKAVLVDYLGKTYKP